MAKYGTKNALFGYCWARILKSFCPIGIQHSPICEIEKVRQKNA